MHCHSVRFELEIRLASDVRAILGVCQERLLGVVEVRVEDFLCERQPAGCAKYVSHLIEFLEKLRVWRCARGEV